MRPHLFERHPCGGRGWAEVVIYGVQASASKVADTIRTTHHVLRNALTSGGGSAKTYTPRVQLRPVQFVMARTIMLIIKRLVLMCFLRNHLPTQLSHTFQLSITRN